MPRKGTPEHDALSRRLDEDKQNPQLRKVMKEIFDKAHALKFIQTVNGAGLPQDAMIREYNEEYNNRLFNHSVHDLPSSFNTAEAFTRYIPSMSVFKLLKEVDHIVSFVDYLDFVTSDDEGLTELAGLQFMEDAVIYSYNGSHDPEELTFQCGESSTFAVSGVSLVKHGSEVNVLMLAGEKCDLAQKTMEIEERFADVAKSPLKPHIMPADELERRAVPLVEGTSLWKTIVMCRIDTVTSTIDVRYISQDCGYSFVGITDDLTVFLDLDGKFIDNRHEEVAKKLAVQISAYQSLFEFIKVCLNLPLYVNRNDEYTKVERHPTAYKDIRGLLKYKKVDRYAPLSDKIATRSVLFIQPSNQDGPSNKTFYAPNIKIETSGYWKTLPLDKIGQDKAGQPIHGRTWVEKRISWVEESSKVEPLSTSSSSRSRSANPGFIYVMRCAGHGKDIFKIGLTKRNAEQRSYELTSSTSAPDQFLVVEDWEVSDCELAEKLIHARLAQFRVNPKREFFHARYSHISSVIREVIEELGPLPSPDAPSDR